MLPFGIPATIFKGKTIPNYIIDSSKYPMLKLAYAVNLPRNHEILVSRMLAITSNSRETLTVKLDSCCKAKSVLERRVFVALSGDVVGRLRLRSLFNSQFGHLRNSVPTPPCLDPGGSGNALKPSIKVQCTQRVFA